MNGKAGSRSIPLIDSVPYIKDWIDQHPQSGNPNSILLCGLGKRVGKKLNERSLGEIYRRYKKEYFPKLCEDPNVPPEDKQNGLLAGIRTNHVFKQWNYLSCVAVYSNIMSCRAVPSGEVLYTGCAHIHYPTHV